MIKTLLLLTLITIFISKNPSEADVNDNLYELNGNIYFIHPEAKYTWFQALILCARENMNLVTIDTPEKSLEIQEILKSNFESINPLWIGALLENENSRQYAWSENGQNLNFTNWAVGQPNHAGHRDHCIQIIEDNAAGDIKWNDEKCSRTFGFICEFNPRFLQAEKLKEMLRHETEMREQLQKELSKSKIFIQLLMDYRKPELESVGNRTIRDIILNIY